MTDYPTSDTDEPGDMAGEYVLGLLDADERRLAEQRVRENAAFAADVAQWQARLGALADEVAPVSPPAEIWPRVEAAIRPAVNTQDAVTEMARLGPPPRRSANPPRPSARAATDAPRGAGFWRPLALATTALAAACLAGLIYVAVLAPAPQPLVAALAADGGATQFLATVATDGRSLAIAPAAPVSSGNGALELWLIPEGGQPHSLGLLDASRPSRLAVPAALRTQIRARATLAVTREPPGGSPSGLPTGPVIAGGLLASL